MAYWQNTLKSDMMLVSPTLRDTCCVVLSGLRPCYEWGADSIRQVYERHGLPDGLESHCVMMIFLVFRIVFWDRDGAVLYEYVVMLCSDSGPLSRSSHLALTNSPKRSRIKMRMKVIDTYFTSLSRILGLNVLHK